MTIAIVERPNTPVLPKEQIDLIRRTVANGATNDELSLFLYDCHRRGVHPLDKLLHFTKRGGRYTPVTSIDFMRSQAAMSGEMAGSDDPVFEAFTSDVHPDVATVTVYRLTQGQKFPYTATARWAEYCPDNAQMWKRMPFTMLGKCAEALALRKAFPQQLAGLYTTDEMDQASRSEDRGYVVEAPAPLTPIPAQEKRENPAAATGESRGTIDSPFVTEGPDLGVDLPAGAVLITKVEPGTGKIAGFIEHSGQHGGDDHLPIYQAQLKALAEQCCQDRTPVFIDRVLSSTSGKPYVRAITTTLPLRVVPSKPLTGGDIAF